MQENPSAPSRRAFLRLAVWVALAVVASVLAVAPTFLPGFIAIPLGALCVFLVPGYWFEQILFPDQREISLTRLPAWFVFSLAVWALPATGLQLLGANWFAFRIVFVVVLWGLLVVAWWRWRDFSSPKLLVDMTNSRTKTPSSPALLPEGEGGKTVLSHGQGSNGATDRSVMPELVLGLLCAVVALVVWGGGRDGDDWGYLQITQQFIQSGPFQLLAASEARYSLRYAFHVWIFLQAFLRQWLHADVVSLARDWLPTLLAPLSLISFYVWAKEFFGRANVALTAVIIQLVIYVTFANMDGWGRSFFVRSAQDKFLVWLIVLPLAFTLAWRFLREPRLANWIAFGAVMIAGLWVHPVSLFLVVVGLAGFALFNYLSRVRFPPRRWLVLGTAALPALLTVPMIRLTTLPSVFTVNTPEVEAYMRISEGRLLFQGQFYVVDPLVFANPIILFSIPLIVLFAKQLRREIRVQFLWGCTLVPLALVFNPFTARLLGEMLTPWQLWRMTWLIPAAFILTQTLLYFRATEGSRRWALAGALAVTALVMVSLSTPNFGRVVSNFQQTHALDAPVDDMLRVLDENLTRPANVMLPRRITRYASAYSGNAVVLSNDAQKPEDTRGQQIDRFYAPDADPKFLEAFLVFWESEYVVAENGSLQDAFLKNHPRATFLYKNGGLTLYKVAPE